jgi:hypothetical protein
MFKVLKVLILQHVGHDFIPPFMGTTIQCLITVLGWIQKFDQFLSGTQGALFKTGVSVRQGEVAVVPHTAVAQPRHKR